jgi:signal transduction protein with GAF and PtsI domain
MANLDAPERLARFRGDLVSNNPDEILEQCVREASRRLEAPIALVSFVMGHVQYFRAATGLPPEIDLSRATARCHSYCQFVVMSEKPLAISDIFARPDMPQAVAQTYGVRSYLGVPVFCEGQLLGTLCVVDVKNRDWSDKEIGTLTELATKVSERLEELARRSLPDMKPAAAIEMRILAQSVADGARVIERALAEVGPMVRLAGGLGVGTLPPEAFVRGAAVLREASELYFDLVDAARNVSGMGEQLTSVMETQPKRGQS